MNSLLSKLPLIDDTPISLDRGLTDFLKIISCLLVAFGHYSGYALVSNVSSSPIYKIIAATGGYIGVAFFFFISGYGCMMSEQKKHLTAKQFFIKRLSKVWLPAVIISAIWLVIALLVDKNLLCNNDYLLGIFWRFNDEVLWFIQAIIILYCFFYFYTIIPCSNEVNKALLLSVISVAAYFTCRMVGIGLTSSVPLFFLGMGVANFPGITAKIGRSKIWIGSIMVLFIAIFFLIYHDNYMIHGWINYLLIALFIISIANFNFRMPIMPKWATDSSLDVYLVHYKTHLLLVSLFSIDLIWMFILGTTASSYLFYKLRKMLRL